MSLNEVLIEAKRRIENTDNQDTILRIKAHVVANFSMSHSLQYNCCHQVRDPRYSTYRVAEDVVNAWFAYLVACDEYEKFVKSIQ